MKKLTFLRYWNVITICLFCLALACLGIFFANGKSGQSAIEVLPAQTESVAVESFSSSGNEIIMGETQNVGEDEVLPSYEISQYKSATVVRGWPKILRPETTHVVQWKIKISNYNGNKYNPVVITVSGCALPEAEISYDSLVYGLPTIPDFASYFRYTTYNGSAHVSQPNVSYDQKYRKFTYTAAPGNANGTYTVTPGQELIVTSFEQTPTVRGVSTVVTSNLFVYQTSSSFGPQKQHNQEYGTTIKLTEDTVSTDAYGATYISSKNNQGVTNTGKYLKSWSMTQTGTDAKFDSSTNTFTFGSTDSKIAGTWGDLTYKIIYKKDGQQMGESTVKYGGTIYGVPTDTQPSEGYSGYYQLLGFVPVSNGDTFTYADNGSTLLATWVEIPNEYQITWFANGGTFENGASEQYTTTTFGHYYTMPQDVIRPGYTFKGWFEGKTESPNFNDKKKDRLESLTGLYLHARWEIKEDLTVRFATDDKVLGFDLKITDVYNDGKTQTTNWQYIKEHSHTFTNIFGLTEFEVSNMTFQDGWVFYQFKLKNTTTGLDAEENVDYALVPNGEKYTIKVFNSLEITVTSCIKLTLQAVSNFSGSYTINNHGGKVAIGDEAFVNETTAVIPYGETAKISANITGIKAEFLGFYLFFESDGVDEENLLSPAGETVWTTNEITKTQTIYAIFKFELYTVNVFAYTDDKNFRESENLDENWFDKDGSKVAVKQSFNKGSVFNFDGSASMLLPSGYDYDLGISIKSSQSPKLKYIFVGFYTDFETMKTDFDNDDPNRITSTNPTITMGDRNITYYAKFVLQYAFTVSAGTEGITSVSIGNESGATSATKFYVYGESIGAIRCNYDTAHYDPRNPAWKVLHGDLTLTQQNLLSTLNITSFGTMPAGYIEISAGVEGKFFNVSVVALFAERDIYIESVIAGTGNITSSNSEQIVFGADGGVMTTHHTITARVQYNSSAITLIANTNSSSTAGSNFVFMGWYGHFAYNSFSERLDSPSSAGVYHVPRITGECTYFCAFAGAYEVRITTDNRVSDIIFENLVTTKTENETTLLFSTLASYQETIRFEVKLSRGLVDKLVQTQSGQGVSITNDATFTFFEFSMPGYPIYITLSTKATEYYLLTLKSYFVDDMQGYYDDDNGFEANCGTVSFDEVATAGTTLRQHVEVASSRTLVATPGVGYAFVGWFKLRTELSFTEILKLDAPSYQTPIQDWFNLYDPNTNPTGSYTFFSNEAIVQSDQIERLDKNMYVAVFVKNYNLTLLAGDKGITDITYFATTTYDTDNDGEFDDFEPVLDDQGSYKLITAPYGTIFNVWTFIADKYQFAEYQIISGSTSLLHYGIANGKILASNGELVEQDDWQLNFYLYDNIQILARTYTTYAELTVGFITYDIYGEPVTSMEGGTFNGATEQGETFEIAIGTSLIGFLKTAPGFVFSHFEINGEVQPHSLTMPSENTMLIVFFDRNAYILETQIKSIGADEILRDSDEGGAVFTDYSILFGDVAKINLVSTIGYQIEGIYVDEACTILAPDFEAQMQATQQIIDYCFHYTYTTIPVTQVPETPTTPVFKLYVVYKLSLFDISTQTKRTDLNTQISGGIEDIEYSIKDFETSVFLDKGFYGQTIYLDLPQNENLRYYNSYNITVTGNTTSEAVELKFFVDGQPVEVSEKGFGCIEDGVTVYFIMPLEDITIHIEATYYQMNLVFDATTNTGTYQNEYAIPDENGNIQAFVYYNFDNYKCKEENSLKNDILTSGVPYATKIGFKLVAYNTKPDRSGVDLITYDYDIYENLTNITINDFVLLQEPEDWQSPITLYAVYDYANIDMLINYCQSAKVLYNGKLQHVLQAEINNFNAEIPYIFTWIDQDGQTVGKYDFHQDAYYDASGNVLSDVSDFYITSQVVEEKIISILQIRSVNQSGVYSCSIEIEGGMLHTPNTPVVANEGRLIEIERKLLTIYLDESFIYYGPTTLAINESNTTGLILDLHTISGTITMPTTGVYDNLHPPVYDLKVSRIDNGEKVQDGFDVLSNYVVNFTGRCEIREATGFISVSSGIYLRVIDAIYMEEIFRTSPETNILVANMLYESFENNSQHRGQGVIVNYFADNDENFGKTITVSYDFRYGYQLHQLRVNGEILDSSKYSIEETTIKFTIDRNLVKDNKIDIQVYITNESLVTAHYNLNEIPNVVIKQVYNQTFNPPAEVIPNEGFILDGWYLDEDFKNKVPLVWQTTGTQDIYAKWVLDDLSKYLAIEVKDNGQVQTLVNGEYEKTYDANAIELNYIFTLPQFTIECVWFKQSQFNVWQQLALGSEQGIYNVSQSGIYSFSAILTAPSGQEQIINVGKFMVQIDILPYLITFADGIFDKTYDGTIDLAKDILINGVLGQLKIEGFFAQKDVLIIDDAVAPIEIKNLNLIGAGNELAENYQIENKVVKGIISPLEVVIAATGKKVYDGHPYSIKHQQKTNANEFVTFLLKTESSDVGVYTQSNLDFEPLAASSQLSNYVFKLGECKVEITKAQHSFAFTNKIFEFDGMPHQLVATLNGEEVSNALEGVENIEYIYTYNNKIIDTLPINAGTYLAEVKIKSDKNYEDFSATASLTIKKAIFNMQLLLNGKDIPESKVFDGKEEYSLFSVQVDVDDRLKSYLGLRLEITKNGLVEPVTSVKDVGIYKITGLYNTNNFEATTPNYAYYKIAGQTIVISNIFEEELLYEYNAKDHLDFVITDALKNEEYVDICTFSIKSTMRKNPEGDFNKVAQIINAGTYKVNVVVHLKDEDSFVIEDGYDVFEILVTVAPYEIKSFKEVNISKTYDGKTTFENMSVVIEFKDLNTKTETISGEFVDKDAGDDVAIRTFTLSNSDNYYYSEENLLSTIQGQILKKNISINLTNNGKYVSILYNNTNQMLYEINENNQRYVLGLVSGEQLFIQISCDTTGFTTDKDYPLSLSDDNDAAVLLLNSAKIVIATGEKDFVNYTIASVSGGINICEQQQIVAEIVENGDNFDNIYANEEKQIYVRLNEILCVYSVSATKFLAVNQGENAPADVAIKDYKPMVDAGTYDIVLILGDSQGFSKFAGGTMIDGQQCLELSYTIVPYQIETTVAITTQYGDSLNNLVNEEEISASEINVSFTFDFILDLSEQDILLPGTYELEFNSIEDDSILQLIPSSNNAKIDNFTLVLTLNLTVASKCVIVDELILNNSVYSGQDQIQEYDKINLSFTDPALNKPLVLENDSFTKVYYLNGVKTLSVENVGKYSVMIFASDDRYVFDDGNGNYYPYKEIANFEITKATITAKIVGTQSYVFDANFHVPAFSVIFTFNDQPVSNISYKLTFGNNLEAIKDAGTYSVNLDITSTNYKLGDYNSVSVTINPCEFILTPPVEGEVWWSKYYGQPDPSVLNKTFVTAYGDAISVNFVRAIGEAIGTYKVSITDEENQRLATKYTNYTVAPFSDQYGAFHILSYKDVSGRLTIEMQDNISIEYTGDYISNIHLTDYKDKFKIYDFNNQEVSSEICDLSNVIFGFESNQIKDVGTYNLVILSVVSTTHDDFNLKLGGRQFIITPKPIAVHLSNYSKVYDAKLDAVIGYEDVVGIYQSDISTVSVTAKFENKNVGEDKIIKLGLTGASAKNYVLSNDVVYGDITPREVAVQGVFDKIYDGNTLVDEKKFILFNVCSGDSITASGNFDDKNAGENKKISFVLDGIDAINYTLGLVNYTGMIHKKALNFAKKDFSKQYDGNANANVELEDIEGIVNGDDISIEKAAYIDMFSLREDATVGDKYLQVILSGIDKDNYQLDFLLTNIKIRYITLYYHYGDEEDYLIEFVSDGESIKKGLITQDVAYGYAVNYPLYNQVNSLVKPSRTGYDFVGWTLDKANTLQFSESTNTDIVDIQTLANNNWTIDLYADWEIQTITFKVMVMTENIANNEFSESNLGGSYLFDDKSISDLIQVAYYQTHKITAIANEFFNLVNIQIDDKVVSTQSEYQFLAIQNAIIKLNFSRNQVSVILHLNDFDVSGFNTAIWKEQNGNIIATTKYGGVIKLPVLSTYGHIFDGFEDEHHVQYAANDTITVSVNNFDLWVKFTSKTIQIAINTNGGVGDENFNYVDKLNKIIEVVYGQKFGDLPTLQKKGYTFVAFMLYNGLNLVEKVDSNTILKSDETNLMLVAIWDKQDNRFEVSSSLEESYYADFGITYFEEFDNPFKIYYNLGTGSGFIEYSDAFSVQTESVVTLKIMNTSPNIYQFAYWQVDGEEISTSLSKDGVQYKLLVDSDESALQISGFVWDNACPSIVAKFIPTILDFTIADYDKNLGSVTVESGVVNNQTLAGAKIALSYTEVMGYHLNENKTSAINANITYTANGQVLLDTVVGDVEFAPVFSQNEYGFTVTKSGFVEGVAYIKYAINNNALADYITETMIRTGDKLFVKIALLNGYTMNLTADKAEIVLVEQSNTNISSAKEIIIDVSGFLRAFNINIEIGKQLYNVSAQKKLYNPLTGLYTSLNENTISVKNAYGQDATQIAYLERAVYFAAVESTPVNQFGNNLENIEYKFLGWYADINDEMILVCGTQTYQFDVVESVEYIAVFEKVIFTVTFICDDSFGKIVGANQELINRIEYITAGSSLQGIYQVLPITGYKFMGWTVVFAYNDANNSKVTQEISDSLVADLGEIHANISCTAKFAKIDIAVKLSANRIDGKELSDATTVQFAENIGHDLDINTQTRTTLTFKAIVGTGFQFVGWSFDNLLSNEYTVLSTQIDKQHIYDEETGEYLGIDQTVHTMEIQFIGNITTYKLIANFDVAEVKVTTTFAVQNLNIVSPGVIVTEDGAMKNSSYTFNTKVDSTLMFYINIFEGFLLLEDDFDSIVVSDNQDVQVSIFNATNDLSSEEKLVFSARYKVIMSGFKVDSDITIWGETQKTTLRFAKLANFRDNTFIENSFNGYIKYYSNKIIVDEGKSLIPQEDNCVFVGWSTTKNQNGLVTDAKGNLLENYWTSLKTVVSLYPIYDFASVRVEVEVFPTHALVNPYTYLQEVFTNESTGYFIENGLYYYNIGASFNLDVPAFVEHYHFDSFVYYVVNSKGLIQQVSIKSEDIETNFATTKMFNITSENAFDYSMASNFANFDHLEDGVMKISIVCSVDINYKAENFYTENCQNVVGGTVYVANLTNTFLAAYNQEVELVAVPNDGYTVKEWWVNGVKHDAKTLILPYQVVEPTEFVVKFVGKSVQITLDTGSAQSVRLTGGNAERQDENLRYLRHVGDVVHLSAIAGEGYIFTNNWLHSNGQQIASEYIISASDGTSGEITLTPVFEERKIQVYLLMPYGFGTITQNGLELSSSRKGDNLEYICSISYFSDLAVQITPIQKHRISQIMLEANNSISDVSGALIGSNFILSHNTYNNAQYLDITISVEKLYWYSILTEENLIYNNALTMDFTGSGKKEDPYQISSVQDLVKLAFVINNGIIQTNTAVKNSYNGATTYYEIVAKIDLEERFWTPIGTSENPFNCNMDIYYMPSNIINDTQDPFFNFALFDQTVLEEYSGLFGYLGENANIQFKVRDTLMLVYIICGILVLLIAIVIILILVHKSRADKLKKFDERNNFLFDTE